MSLEQGAGSRSRARGGLAWASLADPAPVPTVMSEAGSETLEDEWQSISEIASTCNTILESLSREGEASRLPWGGARVGARGGAHGLLSPLAGLGTSSLGASTVDKPTVRKLPAPTGDWL